MSIADDSQAEVVQPFLELVRMTPGPAQRSVDIARRMVAEPIEELLAALVKDEFEQLEA